jgi:hypothetical protein
MLKALPHTKKTKRVKKEKIEDEKWEKNVDNIVMHKSPNESNEVECRTMDKAMSDKFNDYFPLGSLAIPNV